MIVTFYSFKGGVGRTQALANVGVALAQAGHSVLTVDFDLEAPGLSKYYQNAFKLSERALGLLDLLQEAQEKDNLSDWQRYVMRLPVRAAGRLSVMTCGNQNSAYAAQVLAFNWKKFFEDHRGGQKIEYLRSEWAETYDFVLIDSRTGITDAGGICTILLPDVLVPVFTANDQSLLGAADVIRRAQRARAGLARAPGPALVFPLASRFDDRTEIELADSWMARFAEELSEFYEPWVPPEFTAREVLERTKLPYVSYYSFGETLPILRDSNSDLSSLGFALRTVATLISQHFDGVAQLLDTSDVVGAGRRARPSTDKLDTSLEARASGSAVDRHSFDWEHNRSPYPGEKPFAVEDAAVFFGRDSEVERLLRLLHATPSDETGQLVGLFGHSGVGTSSLVQAGVIPRLSLKTWVVLPACVLNADPLGSLAVSLQTVYKAQGRQHVSRDEIVRRVSQGASELVSLLQELLAGVTASNVLLPIDESGDDDSTRTLSVEVRRFLDLLAEAVRQTHALWVLSAMNSSRLCEPQIGKLFSSVVMVESLDPNGLVQVIEQPAVIGNIEFEPGLVRRIVEDAVSGEALPMLARLLRQIYERHSKSRRVSVQEYERSGGLIAILTQRADDLRRKFQSRGEELQFINTLLLFVGLDDAGAYVRRRLRKEVLSADDRSVVDALVRARLMIASGADGSVEYRISHSGLISSWAPLRDAISENRERLRLRSDLIRLNQDWLDAKRDDSYLVRGARLLNLKYSLSVFAVQLSPDEKVFIEASERADKRDSDRMRLLKGAAIGLAVLLPLALIYVIALLFVSSGS